MKSIEIKSPIWKTRSIGIAKYKVTDDIKIDIVYKNKNGERLYPDSYVVKKHIAMSYPIQTLKSGIELYIIPIKELELANNLV